MGPNGQNADAQGMANSCASADVDRAQFARIHSRVLTERHPMNRYVPTSAFGAPAQQPRGRELGGILPSQAIERLIAEGAIRLDRPAASDQIQPASLDLRLGSVVHRVRASFLPGAGRTVSERLEEFRLHTMSLEDGAVL